MGMDLMGSRSGELGCVTDQKLWEMQLESRGQSVKGLSCQTESFVLQAKRTENWGFIGKASFIEDYFIVISCVP